MVKESKYLLIIIPLKRKYIRRIYYETRRGNCQACIDKNMFEKIGGIEND